MFTNDLDSTHTRGVAIYVDQQLDASEVNIETKFNESVFIKIKSGLIIGNIYRSPGSNQDNDNALCALIESVSTKFSNFILVGDFNFNDIDWYKWCSLQNKASSCQFLNALRDNLLLQHIDVPTRRRGTDNPHVLDLVITNNEIVDDINYLAPLGKSDHTVLMIHTQLCDKKTDAVRNLNFRKGNYAGLRSFLDRDWEALLQPHIGNVEMMWSVFKDKLLEGISIYIPSTLPFSSWKKEKWKRPLDMQVRNEIKKKSALWRQYIRSQDPKVLQQYKTVRNKVRSYTRMVDKRIQNDVAKTSKSNPKAFWKYVKSKTKGKEPIGDLKYVDQHGNVELASTDVCKADALCDFFSNVFNKDTDSNFIILGSKKSQYPSELPLFDCDDIKIRLQKLNTNKSPGPDGIHPRILVEAANQIAYPLKLLFECSFITSHLPAEWKYANITPLHKKGSRMDIGNYRPVSLTSVICKLMEAIVRDHVMSYFKSNKLFSDKQFGFIKGRSTVLQLLQIMDKWTEFLDLGGQVDVVYTDLEKAFDKIPHKRLISKLHSYGLNNGIIDWIEAFLTNRKQRVRIKQSYSKWAQVISGVPQGSVLGPILFIIYINDLIEHCDSGSDIFLFADDAKIFSLVSKKEDCITLQQDLDKFNDWIGKWLLSLNVGKCKTVSIGKNNEIFSTYTISGHIIDKVQTIKDLGVVFDSRLKFDEHIDEKVNKAYQMLGIIKRNFIHLTPDSFVVLYKALVRSHLEYAVSVWNPHYQFLIEKLEKVQKRATKLVFTVKSLNYEERLRKLNLPTLKFRRIRGDMIEVYKIFNGKYDEEVTSWLRSRHCESYYDLRGHQFKIYQSQIHSDIRKFNFANRVASLWNSLPEAVVCADTVDTFKNRLDKFWQDQEVLYNWKADICTGSRSQVNVILD